MKNNSSHYFIFCCRWVLFLGLACASHTGNSQESFRISNQLNEALWLQDTAAIDRYIQYARRLKKQGDEREEGIWRASLASSKRLKYESGVKNSLTGLAEVYVAKEQYEQAIKLYRETALFCQEIPSLTNAVPLIYNNLANVYLKTGNLEKAIPYYKQAASLTETHEVRNSGEIYNNLAGVLMQLKSYDQVLSYLDKGGQLALQESNYHTLVAVYTNKSIYYFETGKWAESLDAALKAQEVARQHDLGQLEYISLVHLGELYRRHKDPRKALSYLLQAQKIKEKAIPYYRNYVAFVSGNVYLDLKEYDKAIDYLEQAVTAAKKGGANTQVQDAYRGLAQGYEAKGDYRQSLINYKAFWTMRDSLESIAIRNDIAAWSLKYRTAEKDKKMLSDQLLINKQKENIRTKNNWIVGISLGATLLIVLLYAFFRINHHKQRLKMSVLQQQQEIDQLKAMITGEEKERERMARELHDGIGGMLAAINMNLSSAWAMQEDAAGKERLHKILDMLKDTSSEVRKTAHNLLPDVLTRYSLEQALMIYCEHINIGNVLQVDFEFHAQIEDLDKSIELILYRISQELLQNILKHAHATTAWLMIKQLDQKLSIIVEDNGSGFAPEEENNGYGLLNLQYRVKALEGNLHMQSDIGQGTTIHIEFDLDKLKTKSSLV